MTEAYLVGTTDQFPVDSELFASQSFKPVASHYLEYIDLDLASIWFHPRPTIEIYRATSDGRPYGDILTVSLSHTPTAFVPGKVYRVRFYMAGYEMLAGKSYCIVVKGVPPWSGSSFVWTYVKDHGAYARGVRSWYDCVAHYWLVVPNDDHIFAEFGRPLEPSNPPEPGPNPPPIPPEPPINLWMVVQRAQYRTATGERMVAVTNTPCHLWFRWTDTPTRIHRIGRSDRGLKSMSDLYYCFDNYQDIEQAEFGDTFLHNFIVEPWPYCVKRYYYYYGTIQDVPSKSTSPIFYKHPKQPPDRMAYATGFNDHSLVGFDLTTPASPKFYKAIRGSGEPNYLGKPYGLASRGDYMYVCSRGDSSLTIVDVTIPKQPIVVASIRGSGSPNYLNGINSVFISGNYAFVTASFDDSLTIINIANPSNPTFTSSIHGAGLPNYLNGASDVVMASGYAYVTAQYDDSLVVIDVLDRSTPKLHGLIKGFGPPNYLNGASHVSVKDNYAYVSSYLDHSFSTFDISKPSSPQLTKVIRGPGARYYLSGTRSNCIAFKE